MLNPDFSMFSNDPVLTSLQNFSLANLHFELGQCVPNAMLDAPLETYQVTNLRYSPLQKMVVGLTSAIGTKPIMLRIFPRGSLQNRLAKARRNHPAHTFLLDDLNAVAWVFPGERKLDLTPLVDRSQLSRMLHKQRGYHLVGLKLIHFVPEHTYTALLDGRRDDGTSVREYLKLYYNDDGARTASIMRQLAAQLRGANISISDDVSYFANERMLVQSELRRDDSAVLGNAAAGRALACFHGLSAMGVHKGTDDYEKSHDDTLSLLEKTSPLFLRDVERASIAVRSALRASAPGPDVLLHGDAHLGNLLPMPGGQVGVIDLDRVRWGAPEDDLASFFAFKLWLNLRDGIEYAALLEQFPQFVDDYNRLARKPVSAQRAYIVLAHKMITERVRRGITRCKISDATELLGFTNIALQCLNAAGRIHA